MRQADAILVVMAAAVGTAAALVADWRVALGLGLIALALRRKGRFGLAAFAVTSLAFNVIVLGLVVSPPTATTAGDIRLSAAGVAVGLEIGLRLACAVAVNFALLDWFPPALVLDGLRLPRRMTGLLAAGILATHAVGQDARRIGLAHRLARAELAVASARDEPNTRPERRGRFAQARASVSMLPALLVAGLRRAQVRRDALRLAGHATGSLFTPIIAIAALAAASRLAFAAVPNVAPTYVVVFLGGVLFGPGVGAAAGALTMVATNVVLTGLLPMPYFSNVPAMAALGALGGLLRRFDWEGRGRADRAAGRILAGVVGTAATLIFSVLADAGSWGYVVVLQWLHHEPVPADALPRLVIMGLAFNVIPAIVNGVVFAAAVPAVVRVWKVFTGGAQRRRVNGVHGDGAMPARSTQQRP